MASTPPSSKRMKTRAIRSGGKLEGWFSGESELIDKYLHETSRKIVNTPKLVSFTWDKATKSDCGEMSSKGAKTEEIP